MYINKVKQDKMYYYVSIVIVLGLCYVLNYLCVL